MQKILNYKTEEDIKEAEKLQAQLYQKYENVKIEMFGLFKAKIIYY